MKVPARLIGAVAAVLLSALAIGCASKPSSFYTLSAAASPLGPPSDLSVAVGPVSVPATVDRPEIVVSEGPNRVRLDEFNRWASPLRSEISRALAENLTTLLGTPNVTQAAETATAGTRYRVVVEVQKLESAPGDWAAFDAMWIVRRTADGASLTGRTRSREPLTEPGFEPLAAAHSRAVARLSEDVADAVRALEGKPGR